MKARLKMKVARKGPLKEVKGMISFATAFTLTVTGSTTLIAGITLIVVSHSEIPSSIRFWQHLRCCHLLLVLVAKATICPPRAREYENREQYPHANL